MASSIHIRFADDELRKMENQIGALGEKKARVGLSRAVSRVTDMVYTATVRAIVKQSGIPRKVVLRAVHKSKPAQKGTGPIFGTVTASGYEIPLRDLGAKQLSYGVRAKVQGKWTRFPGTFIFAGTYRSGQEIAAGHVFQRDGKKRLRQRQTKGGRNRKWVQPIARVPSGVYVADELIRDQSLAAFEAIVRTKLPERAMHELGRLLNA